MGTQSPICEGDRGDSKMSPLHYFVELSYIMSDKAYQFYDEFRKFLIKPQVGTLGFITAVVAGNSTYQFLKSFVADILMPIIGLIIGRKRLAQFSIGEIQIGQFLVDLITWVVIMLVLFLFIEYLLKSVFLQKGDEETQYYKEKYEKNFLDNILQPPQTLDDNIDKQKNYRKIFGLS